MCARWSRRWHLVRKPRHRRQLHRLAALSSRGAKHDKASMTPEHVNPTYPSEKRRLHHRRCDTGMARAQLPPSCHWHSGARLAHSSAVPRHCPAYIRCRCVHKTGFVLERPRSAHRRARTSGDAARSARATRCCVVCGGAPIGDWVRKCCAGTAPQCSELDAPD